MATLVFCCGDGGRRRGVHEGCEVIRFDNRWLYNLSRGVFSGKRFQKVVVELAVRLRMFGQRDVRMLQAALMELLRMVAHDGLVLNLQIVRILAPWDLVALSEAVCRCMWTREATLCRTNVS